MTYPVAPANRCRAGGASACAAMVETVVTKVSIVDSGDGELIDLGPAVQMRILEDGSTPSTGSVSRCRREQGRDQ